MRQKGVAQILLMAIVIVGLFVVLYLSQRSQVIKSKASYIDPSFAKNTLMSKAAPPTDEYGDRVLFKSTKLGVDDNPRYELEYQPSNQYKPTEDYILVINDTPIEQVREEAEKDLLIQSGGNINSLCAMNIKVVSPGLVTGGDTATDDQLGLCKQSTGGDTPSAPQDTVTESNTVQFSSLQPMVISQDFPSGTLMDVCFSSNGLEGTWKITNNPSVGTFASSHFVSSSRCTDPLPKNMTFDQQVPSGSFIHLCQADDPSANEWVWQVDSSGLSATFLYSQKGCMPVPQSSFQKAIFSFKHQPTCNVGISYCTTDLLKFFFGSHADDASRICNRESGGINDWVSHTGDVGLFQINIEAHGGTVEQWSNPIENIKKAVELSNGGTDWHSWSAAYDYVCLDDKKSSACSFYSGRPPWQADCM